MIKIDVKKDKLVISGTPKEILMDFAFIALNLFDALGTDAVVDAVCRAYDSYIKTHDTDGDFTL